MCHGDVYVVCNYIFCFCLCNGAIYVPGQSGFYLCLALVSHVNFSYGVTVLHLYGDGLLGHQLGFHYVRVDPVDELYFVISIGGR